jgi:hypothetical protein
MVDVQQWTAPSLEQAIEIAQGVLPREFQSWDEVPGRSALLPTPTAQDHCGSRNSTANRSPTAKEVHIGDTLTDWAWKHERWTGEPTPPPSTDGNTCSDD